MTKTFSLGPAWIAVGRAAEQAHPEIVHAFAEATKLAQARGSLCSISAVVGGEIVILGTAAGGAPMLRRRGSVSEFPSRRLRLERAGGGRRAGARGLARARGTGHSAEERARHRRRVESVSARGYGIERLSEAQARLRQVLVELQADPLADELEQQVARLAQELHRREGDFAIDGAGPISEIFARSPVRV